MAPPIRAPVLPRRIQPLIVDQANGQAVLIDGRNRREACRRAGIIPDYVLLDGADPVTYILSANINRRHMTKGQRAIVVAKICLETKQPVREAAKQSGLKDNCVFYASTILRHAPDLSDAVLRGHLSLDNAYEEARIRKGRAETYEARFNTLKVDTPDLAEMVVEEKLTLEEAEAARRARLIFPWRLKLGGVDHRKRVLRNDFVLVEGLAASLRVPFAQVLYTD